MTKKGIWIWIYLLAVVTLVMVPVMSAGASGIETVKVELPGNIMLTVVQQPDRHYVPNRSGVVAEYMIAKGLGDVVGFVAHDYLAGALFYELRIGDMIRVTFANGAVEYFQVATWQLVKYDGVIDPYAVYYTGARRVTFQTCWGTVGWLFVVAWPAAEITWIKQSQPQINTDEHGLVWRMR